MVANEALHTVPARRSSDLGLNYVLKNQWNSHLRRVAENPQLYECHLQFQTISLTCKKGHLLEGYFSIVIGIHHADPIRLPQGKGCTPEATAGCIKCSNQTPLIHSKVLWRMFHPV